MSKKPKKNAVVKGEVSVVPPKVKSAKKAAPFTFREQDKIGANEAVRDRDFLDDCFVDTGDLASLISTSDSRCIVLGRAGAGKTALLMQLARTEERVVEIRPDDLALNYITNSQILQYVMGLGVDLTNFFNSLWRHIFALEIIKAAFQVDDESGATNVMTFLRRMFTSPQHKMALAYLEKYSGKYWEETQTNVTEKTYKVEREINDEIHARMGECGITLGEKDKLSEEQKMECRTRVQHIVNEVQLAELGKVVDMLEAHLLKEHQKRFFFVIDGLDENWIDDTLRYQLIRALIETMSKINQRVTPVKSIATLRVDLLERVYDRTRAPGFQSEKYKDLNLELVWSTSRLVEVVDRRVQKLIRSRYSESKPVNLQMLLPHRIDNKPAIDYMLDRTLMRPRDIIEFFNECIRSAVNDPVLNEVTIKKAEGPYSHSRLESISDEWLADYPQLSLLALTFLKGKSKKFALRALTDEECVDFCFGHADADSDASDPISSVMRAVVLGVSDASDFRNQVALAFFRSSMAGLKVEQYEATIWSHAKRQKVTLDQLHPDTVLEVHPCLWRALSIR